MKPPSKASIIIAAIVLLICSQAVICANTTPNSIDSCLSKSDGSTVTLTGVQVMWQGRSGKSFAIKEWTEKWPLHPRILVVSSEQLPVEAYWTINATGTLITLSETEPDGTKIEQRAVLVRPSDVQVLCDRHGKPSPVCIFTNGIPLPGMSTRPLTDFVPDETLSTTEQMTVESQTENLPSLPDSPEPAPPTPGSKDSLKHLPDGALVSMNGAIVVLGPNWMQTNDFFYVERSDRSFGIKVKASTLPEVGELVDITGRLATVGGERAIIADSVTNLGYNYPLSAPVGMNNRALGGGMVDAFTPAVGNGSGPNNTGLLVKTWGKVTSVVDENNRIYELTDGSTVDGQPITVRVHDNNLPWDPLPSVGDFLTIYGISGAEIPEGLSTSVRVLYHTEPTIPSYQPGNGTISGTITAAGADGKTIRIYCAKASTTATFSGNTANYTLSVPYGDHAITTSLLGYKTTTQLVTVSSSSPNATCNFTLSTLQRRVDVVSSPDRIPPDGVTTATITAIMRDEEGKRYANEPVTWNVDLGTVISSDSTTNAVGEARAEIRSTVNHETATISVQCGTITGYGYIDFADPNDPYIRLTEPINGVDLSGFTAVYAIISTETDDITAMTLYVDDQQMGTITSNEYYLSGLDTSQLSNGPHVLSASVRDSNGNIMLSQRILVNVYNTLSELAVGPTEIFSDMADQPNIQISGILNEPGYWSVIITDMSGNTVFSDSGNQGPFTSSWDGRVNNSYQDGLYTVSLSAGDKSYKYAITISAAHAPVLITGLFRSEEQWSKNATIEEITAVMDACREKGARFTAILDPLWKTGMDHEVNRNRKGLDDWLAEGFRYWFHSGHGTIKTTPDGAQYVRIQFPSTDGIVWAYGNDYWKEPENRQFIEAFSDINIWPSQYNIVMLNCCWSGGHYLWGVDESIPNAFGNYGDIEGDQTFIGWSFWYYPTNYPYLGGLSPSGTLWTKEFWYRLGGGYTVNQAAWWANYKTVGWMQDFVIFYGGPYVTYFNP